MTIPSYPLCWPDSVSRTPLHGRIRSPFRTGYDGARANVIQSLRLFDKEAGVRIESPQISSNVDLLGRLSPSDSGIAVWFKMDGLQACFAIDRFNAPACNLQAIHHVIEARRTELRYGGLAIVRQTFRSFMALPAPQVAPWWEVLGVKQNDTLEDIEAAFRRLAAECHPDKGGSDAQMAELNSARDRARKERT